jgi:rubrerythrin
MGLKIDFAKLAGADVLDLAIFAENEAHEYYEELAALMQRRSNGEAASLFRRMAGWEALHRDQITALRESLFPRVASRLADRAAWEVEVPRNTSGEASVSLLEALKIALAAEVDAHDYYASAIEYVTDPKIASLFETLRLAELDHQRMLQQEIAKL